MVDNLPDDRLRSLEDRNAYLEAVIDSVSAHIAILDARGRIIHTNRQWQDFARTNQIKMRPDSLGINYLEVCERARGDSADKARSVAAGIRQVISGDRDEYAVDYPCHSPHEERWFYMRVRRFTGAGPFRLVITHENITALKRAQQDLAESNITLQKLLDRREQDRRDIQAGVVSTLRRLVMPHLERLKTEGLTEDGLKDLDVVIAHLSGLAQSSMRHLAGLDLGLTPTELEVAALVREGRSSKDIAELLSVSLETVSFHRRNIRRKLYIDNTAINLRTRLLSLTEW